MKKLIILAIIFGLASNFSLAMKREREEQELAPAGESENKESRVEQAEERPLTLKQRLEALDKDLVPKSPFAREGIVLDIPVEQIPQGIEFIKSNNLQSDYPTTLGVFNARIFIQCNDGTIKHFSRSALNQMRTMRDLLADAPGAITIEDPLPVPNMNTAQFMALYQMTINYIAQSEKRGFAQLSDNAKIENLHVPLQHILHRHNFTAIDLLVPAFYLSLPDLVLDALAREAAIEIGKYPKAFPAFTYTGREKDPGVLYTEFLPDNVKALSKDILASIMRQFFLINSNETQPRLISKCYHKDDIFCLKTLQFDLPMKPFSIAELLHYKKINTRLAGLDLRHMNINDAVGFENIPALNHIKTVMLNNNQLRELPATFLHNFPQLQWLYLQNNQLRELPVNFLNNCPQLQHLTLHQNQLRELPANFLNNCPQLQKLALNNNQLQGLPANFLNNCPQLQGLTLSHNQLQQVPTNFLHNKAQLQAFTIFNNQLSNETIEEIKEVLLRQGKVVDGLKIRLEPQTVESKPE